MPGATTLEVLAGFFVCPIDYLVGKTDQRYYQWDDRFTGGKEDATGAEPGTVSDEDLKFAMFGTTEISDEKLAEIRRYAQYIKDL